MQVRCFGMKIAANVLAAVTIRGIEATHKQHQEWKHSVTGGFEFRVHMSLAPCLAYFFIS